MSDEAGELKQLREAVEDLQAQVAALRAGPGSDFSSKMERLNYYRREDTQEWTLLTNRVNSYITSQSFLITAFAASMANPDLRFRVLFPVVVSAIGMVASVRAYPGIDGACKVIQLWHDKKTQLLADPCLCDFCDGRAAMPPETLYRRLVVRLTARSRVGKRGSYGQAADGERVDEIHVTSLYFAQVAPKLFGGAWAVLLALALALHFVH